jgi:hypothetical protein
MRTFLCFVVHVPACCSFSGKVMLQYYTPQQGAAACILQLAYRLAMAGEEAAAIAEQVGEAHLVCSTDNVL